MQVPRNDTKFAQMKAVVCTNAESDDIPIAPCSAAKEAKKSKKLRGLSPNGPNFCRMADSLAFIPLQPSSSIAPTQLHPLVPERQIHFLSPRQHPSAPSFAMLAQIMGVPAPHFAGDRIPQQSFLSPSHPSGIPNVSRSGDSYQMPIHAPSHRRNSSGSISPPGQRAPLDLPTEGRRLQLLSGPWSRTHSGLPHATASTCSHGEDDPRSHPPAAAAQQRLCRWQSGLPGGCRADPYPPATASTCGHGGAPLPTMTPTPPTTPTPLFSTPVRHGAPAPFEPPSPAATGCRAAARMADPFHDDWAHW
jgi:hypothetical protein